MTNTRSRRARLQRAVLCLTAAALVVLPGIALAHPAASAKTAATTVVETHKTSQAVVLATSSGHTLYMFNHDGFNKSHCSGACAKTWQPLIAHGKVSAKAKSGLKAKLLGTIKRKDGRIQVVYNKYPLYTNVKDKKAGQDKGWATHSFGGYWWTVNTKGYAIELFNGFPTGCPSPLSQGGYGC
jgi:predicted lipoprotein with Yx(FWY)xxD motif